MTFVLSAKKRTKKPAALRSEGMLPGILYGRKVESVPFAVEYTAFEKMYDQAGTSNLIDFSIEDAAPVNVVIKDWQLDPVRQQFTHIDLYQVDMTQEMESDVELVFIGTAPAEKMGGGTLMTSHDTISVRCLPKHLPDHIDVDLSVLSSFDDIITVKDLKLPEGVTCTDAPDILVATVNAPLSAEELQKLETSEVVDVTAVKVEEKKTPEEEGADASAGSAQEQEAKK